MAAPGRRAAYKLRPADGMWLPLNGSSATSPIWQLKDQLISAASKCASTKGRCVIWNVDQDDAAHIQYLSTGQSDEGQTLSTNCSESGFYPMHRNAGSTSAVLSGDLPPRAASISRIDAQ